jgi:hypothetical protein
MAKAKIINPTMDNYDGEFHEFSEEQTSSRTIEVSDQKFNIVQENPWNLWRVVPSKGHVPEDLEGKFTSVMMAEQAIVRYVNKRDKVSLSA